MTLNNAPRSDHANTIRHPDQPALTELRKLLLEEPPPDRDPSEGWIRRQWDLCVRFGVPRWFVPDSLGGFGWNDADIIRGYLALSSACLATTFVLTQWVSAVKRIVGGDNSELARRIVPGLLDGKRFTTVGVSHLTTSRQHLARPAMQVRRCDRRSGFLLDGYSPWVTAAPLATEIVTGGTMDDGRQVLLVAPTDSEGMEIGASQELIALSSSLTGPVTCRNVFVADENLVAGPAQRVMESDSTSAGAFTGGVQTSTLALGLAAAAIDFIEEQARSRPKLGDSHKTLRQTWRELVDGLHGAAAADLAAPTGGSGALSNPLDKDELRSRANSLVLRTTQAAMVVARGAGFVSGHPVGRWCREALFFLVWSCPQAVQDANLCEFAAAFESDADSGGDSP